MVVDHRSCHRWDNMPTAMNIMTLRIIRHTSLCLALAASTTWAQTAVDMESLEAAAARGDTRALFTLAVHYERGEHVTRDFIKSNALYCKAAARGDTEALVKLGIVYSIGRGVMADEGIAALLIGKAAELGSERAQQLLEHVSKRADTVAPACLSEATEAAAAPDDGPPVSAARKDIELLVKRWAPEYSVDPDLVMALISTESSFNPKAVSPKNAQGLMQLIPATAARFGVRNAFNPLDNLKGGLAYLRWLMAYFQGEVALVLAAYNAGEEAVERFRGIPPYQETRNYVKQITSVYRKATHPFLAEIVAPSPALSRIPRSGR
jgi:soluble lytic murein transglycosylase-like protein